MNLDRRHFWGLYAITFTLLAIHQLVIQNWFWFIWDSILVVAGLYFIVDAYYDMEAKCES